MTEKVRVGIIGVGGMGSGHATTVPHLPEAMLTAICDINPKRIETSQAEYGVPAFSTPSELINSGLVEAVIIATPHYDHTTIGIEAFANRLHVLSEKPISVTVGDADKLIAAAKASGKKFGVMYQMRGEPQNQAAHRLISEGHIGEIYRINLVMGWYRSQAYYNSGSWRATWKGEGGGVLINQAPHLLDLFTWLGGLPTAITGKTHTRLHDIEVEDEASAVLEYANGAHGYLYASTTEVPQKQCLEICGDKGKIVLEHGKIQLFEVAEGIRHFTETSESMWSDPKAEEVPVELQPEGQFKGHSAITQNFLRSILYNEPLIAPGEDGLNAIEMINGIILSSKQNRQVTVPVDRAEYAALMTELQASSVTKSGVVEKRETDPNHVR